MFGFRVLLFVVAYIVVIGEILIGSTIENPTHKIILIIPGGLMLALLLATSFLLLPQISSEGKAPPQSTFVHWAVLVIIGMAMAAASFYFPLYIMPLLKANM